MSTPASLAGAMCTRAARAFVLMGLFLTSALHAPTARAHGDEDHGRPSPSAAIAANAATAPAGAGTEAPQRLGDGSLFVPKPLQRRLGLRTLRVRSQALAAALVLNGRIVADPQASGRLQAPSAGSLRPGAKGMPLPGRRVVAGEVLLQLQPVASAIELANQKALLAELDAQRALAQRKMSRYAQLEGALPAKDIEAARIELDALEQRRRLVAASVEASVPLRAPIGGVISSAQPLAAGQIVDAREVLLDIVDPTRLAVEALLYEPALAASLQSAQMRVGTRSYTLRRLAAGRQLREQALPLLFRIEGADAALNLGQPVTVLARTARQVQGQAVPRRALTRTAGGQTAVWLHTEPERFERRLVRTQPLDAQTVAVVEGLHEGERVVTDGASLLAQVR